MKIGSLRDRISIQAPTKSKDALGAPTRVWVPVWVCHARIETLKGREYFGGGHEEAAGDAKITFRYPPRAITVNADCRIVDSRRNITYAISGVMFDDKRTRMTAVCVSGVSDG